MRRIVSSLSLPLALVAFAAVFAGCGGPRVYSIAGTQRDPGVDARLQIERIEGGNNLLTLTVRFLTPPERHGDANTVFMVWIRQQNGTTLLASQLGYTPDTREGRATAGLSMGGFGAMQLALRHQDLFSAAASHSGMVSLLYDGPHPHAPGKVT